MKRISFKNILSGLLASLALTCFAFGFVACNKNEQENKTKEEITAWATETNETVNYYDYYYAPIDILLANGEEFLPTVKVEDSNGEGVPLVSNKFLVEDVNGYEVKYLVAYNGEIFEKKITLSIVIKDPNVFVGDIENCYAGIDILVPTIAVMENDGEKLDYSYKVFNAQNEEVTVSDGKFNPPVSGDYYFVVTAQGENGNTIVHKEPFIVEDIPMGEDILLKSAEINTDWFSTPNGLMLENDTVYGYKGIISNGKDMTVALDLGISLEVLREKFVYISVVLMYWGDGINSVNLKYTPEGEPQPVYFTSGVDSDGEYPNFTFWQRYIVTVPTAEFDGNLYLSSTGDGTTSYKFGFVSATAKCDGLIVGEYEKEQMLNGAFSMPSVTYVLNNVEQTDINVSVSAKFNGADIQVKDSYIFDEIGELVVTYTYKNLVKTITFNINTGKKLVTSENLMRKIVSSSYTVAAPQIGNVTGGMYATEAAYAIKLPGDENPANGGASVTIVIEVGDVSNFKKLEIKFWALGIGGDTWYLSTGNTQLFSAASWRGFDNPVTVEIPVSAVVDGKLSLTFQQTWGTGDELYIQYIEALA